MIPGLPEAAAAVAPATDAETQLAAPKGPPDLHHTGAPPLQPERPAPVPAAALAQTAPAVLVAEGALSAEALLLPEGEELGLAAPLGLPPPAGPAASAGLPTASLAHLAARMVETLVQRPDGTTEIALSPDELGRVQVTVQTDAQNPDRVVLFLSFDRPETLDLFRRHADQLTEAMRASGFAEADIGFGSSGPGGGTGQGADPHPDPGRAAEAAATDGAGDRSARARLPDLPPQPHLAGDGGLDLRL